MSPHNALVFLAMAIQLRDNAKTMPEDQFRSLIKEVAEFGVMSNRQLAKLCGNRLNHVAIGRIVPKVTRTGGM